MTGTEILVLAAGAGAVAWVADLAVNPRAPCRVCEGHRGRHSLSRGKAYGHCRKCGGSGERLRFGARAVARAMGREL